MAGHFHPRVETLLRLRSCGRPRPTRHSWDGSREPQRFLGEPKSLGPTINSDVRDNSPVLSSDGHWLVFSSARVTGRCSDQTGNDIFISHRADAEDDFAWEPPVNFGCELSGIGENAAMTFFEDETTGTTTLYVASNRPGGIGAFDIYSSTRQFNGTFGTPVLVPELSSPLFDVSQTVRRDGLAMILVYSATTGPFTDGDLWVSTRDTTSQPWSIPVNLGPAVNTDADDSFPSLSCDGTELYFASTRVGGLGMDDLYVSTRRKLDESPSVLEPLDYALRESMESYWTNFAKISDPNGTNIRTGRASKRKPKPLWN